MLCRICYAQICDIVGGHFGRTDALTGAHHIVRVLCVEQISADASLAVDTRAPTLLAALQSGQAYFSRYRNTASAMANAPGSESAYAHLVVGEMASAIIENDRRVAVAKGELATAAEQMVPQLYRP